MSETMLDKLKIKIRALIEDLDKNGFEIFEYTGSKIFTISETNIKSITSVLKNGNTLGSGEYSYDSTTNKIEILASLSDSDKIEVNYIYNKYSDNELTEYIIASLVWISIYSNAYEEDFEVEEEEIYPTPSNRELDLICIISSILIKPDWVSYNLPNLRITYPRTMTREKKMESIIKEFYSGTGITDFVEF